MTIFSCFRSKKSPHNHDLTHQPRLPPVLFPLQEYTAPIHLWAGAIQVLNAGECSDCRIRKISHCKATSSSSSADRHGYEFLLVHVRHPSGKDAIVRAERLSTSSSPFSTSNSSHTPAHGDPPHTIPTAHDRVSLSYDGTTDCLTRHVTSYAELLTLSFPKSSEAPSVAHLAALLVTLNTHGGPTGAAVVPGTGGTEQPSAWFAYSTVEVLKAIFGGKVKKSKGWVKAPYGGMEVDGADGVDALLRRYTRTWEDFSRKLGVGDRTPGQDSGDNSRSATSNSKPKLRERKKAKERAEMDAFADML